MAREHLNSIVMAGPMSRLKVYDVDKWGNTKTGFVVGGPKGEDGIMVSAKFKYESAIRQAQTASSVVVTRGFMNGWIDDRTEKKRMVLRVEARPSGVLFGTSPVAPYKRAQVEGVVAGLNGQWATLHCSYKIPSSNTVRDRLVSVLLGNSLPADVVGQVCFVVGVPMAKYNGQWYLHLQAEAYWILGK